MKAILSPTTPDSEKIRLCRKVGLFENDKVKRHASILSACLNVENSEGEPLNEARMVIWRALYRSTDVKHPLTLKAYKTDDQFKNAADIISNIFIDEYRYKSNGKYPYEQHEKLAEEATKQLITIWVKGNTGKTGVSK